MSANSCGNGIGSCPSIIRVSPSTETTAVVGSCDLGQRLGVDKRQDSGNAVSQGVGLAANKFLGPCQALFLSEYRLTAGAAARTYRRRRAVAGTAQDCCRAPIAAESRVASAGG
jgi:hypothetical protein